MIKAGWINTLMSLAVQVFGHDQSFELLKFWPDGDARWKRQHASAAVFFWRIKCDPHVTATAAAIWQYLTPPNSWLIQIWEKMCEAGLSVYTQFTPSKVVTKEEISCRDQMFLFIW